MLMLPCARAASAGGRPIEYIALTREDTAKSTGRVDRGRQRRPFSPPPCSTFRSARNAVPRQLLSHRHRRRSLCLRRAGPRGPAGRGQVEADQFLWPLDVQPAAIEQGGGPDVIALNRLEFPEHLHPLRRRADEA